MTTRMVSCKTEDDIPLQGVSLQVTDNKIEAVIITDGENTIRIVKSSDYSSDLKILKPAPKIPVEKWFVCGKLLGLAEYEQEVGSEHEGKMAVLSLKEEHGIYQDEQLGLKVESRTLMVDDIKI